MNSAILNLTTHFTESNICKSGKIVAHTSCLLFLLDFNKCRNIPKKSFCYFRHWVLSVRITCGQFKHVLTLTTVKQCFNIRLVGQVQIRLPLKNLKKNKVTRQSFLCEMQMCTLTEKNIQFTWAWRCINDSAISGWSRGPVKYQTQDETRQHFLQKQIKSSLQAFITLLKYTERGRGQHLGQAFDVGDVLLLPSKYVNHLNTKRERESDIWSHKHVRLLQHMVFF